MNGNQKTRIPPGQQLVGSGKWPFVGERSAAPHQGPWTLTLTGKSDQKSLSLDDLGGLPWHTMTIDIHCVTRWSKLDATFAGVLLKDLMDLISPEPDEKYVSFVAHSLREHSSSLELETALAQQTLIVLEYEGQPLEDCHGGPLRNIVPGRYFYKSVKWLKEIKLLTEDQLGYWEADSGYHNEADPWKEQRYMVPNIDRRLAIELIASRDFSNRDLRSIDAQKRDLSELNAESALLRDAVFIASNLEKANFRSANLSNAHFRNANLREADFSGGDLEGADFSGADLSGADLSGCSLIGASFWSELDGQTLKATFDQHTKFPAEIREPLFPEQRDFVDESLRNLNNPS